MIESLEEIQDEEASVEVTSRSSLSNFDNFEIGWTGVVSNSLISLILEIRRRFLPARFAVFCHGAVIRVKI